MSTLMPSPGPAPASREVAGTESPLFSIITPMYNVADVVGSAIRSAQAQTLGDFELIAIDDGTRRIYRRTFMEAAGPYDPPPRERVEFMEKLLETCFIPFSATTLRRSVIEEIGGFDPRLAGTDDYELWLRVLARGYGAVRAPGTLAVMRRRTGQISGDLPVMWRNLRQAYLLVAEEFDIPESVRLRARRRADQLLPAIADAERRAAESRDMGATGRAFHSAWSLRMKLTWVRHWRVRPPEDIAAVFPDLRRR